MNHIYAHEQLIINSIIWIHDNDVRPSVGVHLWWFLGYAELGLKGLSLNHTQSRSLSPLGPNKSNDYDLLRLSPPNLLLECE